MNNVLKIHITIHILDKNHIDAVNAARLSNKAVILIPYYHTDWVESTSMNSL